VFCWDSQDELNSFPAGMDRLCEEESCRSEFLPSPISCSPMMLLRYVTDHLSFFFQIPFFFASSALILSFDSRHLFSKGAPVLSLFQDFRFLQLFLKSAFLPSFFPSPLGLRVPSFCFLSILSFLILLHFGLFYSFFLIMTGVELSTLPACSVHPHQLLYNFQSIFVFFSNFLSLPPGQAGQDTHFQKQKTSSKSTEKSLSKAR